MSGAYNANPVDSNYRLSDAGSQGYRDGLSSMQALMVLHGVRHESGLSQPSNNIAGDSLCLYLPIHSGGLWRELWVLLSSHW